VSTAKTVVKAVNQPEEELLLSSARTATADLTRRIHEILRGDIDWARVANLADRHRITPLLYRQLSRIAPEVLTQPALRQIAGRFHCIARRNLLLAKELLLLLELFQKNQISVIPFKGPLLAVSVFGDLCGREFGDLDLLLRPADIPSARRLLQSRGYRPELKMDAVIEAAYVRSEHAFQYLRDEDNLVVELHWRLEDHYLKFPFDPAMLWSSARGEELFGNPVSTLSPEIMFLYLCMHGAKHYWERLEWIACLPAVIRRYADIKWPRVIELARSMGGLRILNLGLLLANQLDPSDAIQAPLAMLGRDPIAEDLSATVWATLFEDEIDNTRREVYRFRFYLKARERLWDRLSVVRSTTIRIPHPNSDVLDHVPLPDSLLFLHYLLGPIRRFKRYGLRGLAGVLNPKHIPLVVLPAGKVKR
jgi:hypothetical protein